MSKRKRSVARTATGAAFMKAIEAYTPDVRRLFDDSIVARLLPAPARALIDVGRSAGCLRAPSRDPTRVS